jgi:putative DNA primase/helicase
MEIVADYGTSVNVVPDGSRESNALHRPHTDLGNAERMLDLYGRDLMSVPGVGWYAWTGKRWEPNLDGAVERAAKKTARRMYELAEEIRKSSRDPHELEIVDSLKHWSRRSESRTAVASAVELARTELRAIVRVEELDRDPYLLNVANGTVDLRTGDLLMPDRAQRITKFASVVYDPEARDTTWESILPWIDHGYDGTLVEYLRLAVGYSATGSVSEDIVHLIDGPGGSVKTTFVEPVRTALGEYGSVAAFDMFVQRKGDQSHPTDLARLMGQRLVVAEEGPKNRNLDMAKIKGLSGGSRVAARFMRKDFFEFDPVLKLWLVTNYRPKVHAEDTGAWRRLRAVPFVNVVPESDRNPQIRDWLKDSPEAQGAVLAWIVSGARDWYALHSAGRRIEVPEVVAARTDEWRRDSDRIGAWLEDECEIAPGAWTSSVALQGSINAWWKTYVSDGDWSAPSLMGALGDELRARGCETAKSPEDIRGWFGIRLRGGV